MHLSARSFARTAARFCALAGLAAPPPTVLPGGYAAVFSPAGTQLAFIQKTAGQSAIYTATYSPAGPPAHVTELTAGNQPDWQPTAG